MISISKAFKLGTNFKGRQIHEESNSIENISSVSRSWINVGNYMCRAISKEKESTLVNKESAPQEAFMAVLSMDDDNGSK